jgi:hypothetical protein
LRVAHLVEAHHSSLFEAAALLVLAISPFLACLYPAVLVALAAGTWVLLIADLAAAISIVPLMCLCNQLSVFPST